MTNDLLFQASSPNGRFRLEVTGPDERVPTFRATFQCVDGSASLIELRGVSFGPFPPAPPETLAVRWNLPDNVCGLFLASGCYGLFRCGAGRRGRRGRFRRGDQEPFTDEEIAAFCARRFPT